MKQSAADYLKGFTMLQSRDALGEAWSVLKETKEKQKCIPCGGDGIQHPKRFQAPCFYCNGTGQVDKT